jgi:hypothetical protein
MKRLAHIPPSLALVFALSVGGPAWAGDSVEASVASPTLQSATPEDVVSPEEKMNTAQQASKDPCSTRWIAKDYKSFRNIKSEVKSSFGDGRILRVFLCGEGEKAYFRVLFISGDGAVSRIRISAVR